MNKFVRFLIVSLLLMSATVNAAEYAWVSAVPKEIHLVPNGLAITGDFDLSESICATGTPSIYLASRDPMFKEKLTLALTAKASGRKIRAVISEPREFSCIEVLGVGFAPIVTHYFWQLVDE